jgi:hypothetical protein
MMHDAVCPLEGALYRHQYLKVDLPGIAALTENEIPDPDLVGYRQTQKRDSSGIQLNKQHLTSADYHSTTTQDDSPTIIQVRQTKTSIFGSIRAKFTNECGPNTVSWKSSHRIHTEFTPIEFTPIEFTPIEFTLNVHRIEPECFNKLK